MERKPKVLILEDNATTRMVISKSLEEQGVDVVVACTLAEAETKLHDDSVNLYLLDVNLPDGESTRLIPKIRLMHPMVPILIMTADNEHSRVSEFFAAGVRDFIRKPIHPLLLASKVLSFIQAYETEKALFEANEVYQRITHEKEQEEQLAHYVYDHILMMHNTSVEGLSVAGRSSGKFCGDILVASKAPNGSLIVMLADATGHGMAAALTIYPMVSTFSAMVAKGLSLGAIIKELSVKHSQSIPQNRFVATILVEVSPSSDSIRIWSGGMPKVLVFGHNGEVVNKIAAQNMAIGILPCDMVSTKMEVLPLKDVKAMALFSDGLIENKVVNGEKISFDDAYQIIEDGIHDLDGLIEKLHGYEDFHTKSQDHDDMTLAYLDLPTIIGELREEESDRVPVSGDFKFHFDLAGAALNNEKFPFSLSEMLAGYGFKKDFCQRVFTVVTELFLNSVDHGLFGIASEVKENDFITYLSVREQAKLAIKLDAKVSVEVVWQESTQTLSLELSDSGEGYEVDTIEHSEDAAYGRGLRLITSLSSSFYYDKNTNTTHVTLEY